ncbi:MAG: hypothetical protein M1835_002056 [Candelina submexicana]|nr:MAG: hypothetical protein M1835_002056 [Candelina submexicana]
MRQHGSLEKDTEANAAAWEAAHGALSGAARWGLYFGVLSAAGFAFSPIYRGLTVQFKVSASSLPSCQPTHPVYFDHSLQRSYKELMKRFIETISFLQMSGMTIGSMIGADRRLREYEGTVRREKRMARDARVWDRYEREYEAKDGKNGVSVVPGSVGKVVRASWVDR